ncbi:phage tail protein [Pseudomonas sp. NFX98]|uniref:phage tail protein n=1 Tax=Pseudomonas sp. NFX98 TaxID=3399122 RepID=UPI0039FC2161
MPWYKSGTVSVALNSNAVIGAGTAFLSNGRVGDGFRGPDGGWYEITNIASDTAMSIAPNYQGATSAAGSYAIAPLQGYVKDSADALRALVNQFGGVLGVLGNTPTQAGVRTALNLTTSDGLTEGAANLYFSAARAIASALTGFVTTTGSPVVATDSIVVAAGKLQAQVSAALPKAGGTLSGPINDAPATPIASAATVDIGAATSGVIAISGNTPITGLGSIAAGARRTVRFLGSLLLTHNAVSLILPTGASITTAANDTAEFLSLGGGNWICLRYNPANGKSVAFSFDRTNIVGTVSQSGGTPTGAVVETGTNASGTYIKFADGTMICRRTVIFSAIPITTAAGSLFYSAGGIPGSGFAANFVAAPEVVINIKPAGGVVWHTVLGNASISSGPSLYLVALSSLTIDVAISQIAIGRWF